MGMILKGSRGISQQRLEQGRIIPAAKNPATSHSSHQWTGRLGAPLRALFERIERMKRYLMLIVLFVIVKNAFSQGSELAIHLFGIGSLPTGDYAKDITSDSKLTRRSGFAIGSKIGLATTGYGAGFEMVAPVGFPGLQWLFSSKAIVNGSATDALQSAYRTELGDSVTLELDYGQWLNVPVMTGFRYDHQFSPAYTMYGLLQAGINFSRMASRTARIGKVVVEKAEYDFARDFGFEFGLGLLFEKRYNLGFRFLSLAKPRYEGSKQLSEIIFPEIITRDIAVLGEERSISMFIVTLGIQLFK